MTDTQKARVKKSKPRQDSGAKQRCQGGGYWPVPPKSSKEYQNERPWPLALDTWQGAPPGPEMGFTVWRQRKTDLKSGSSPPSSKQQRPGGMSGSEAKRGWPWSAWLRATWSQGTARARRGLAEACLGQYAEESRYFRHQPLTKTATSTVQGRPCRRRSSPWGLPSTPLPKRTPGSRTSRGEPRPS